LIADNSLTTNRTAAVRWLILPFQPRRSLDRANLAKRNAPSILASSAAQALVQNSTDSGIFASQSKICLLALGSVAMSTNTASMPSNDDPLFKPSASMFPLFDYLCPRPSRGRGSSPTPGRLSDASLAPQDLRTLRLGAMATFFNSVCIAVF